MRHDGCDSEEADEDLAARRSVAGKFTCMLGIEIGVCRNTLTATCLLNTFPVKYVHGILIEYIPLCVFVKCVQAEIPVQHREYVEVCAWSKDTGSTNRNRIGVGPCYMFASLRKSGPLMKRKLFPVIFVFLRNSFTFRFPRSMGSTSSRPRICPCTNSSVYIL